MDSGGHGVARRGPSQAVYPLAVPVPKPQTSEQKRRWRRLRVLQAINFVVVVGLFCMAFSIEPSRAATVPVLLVVTMVYVTVSAGMLLWSYSRLTRDIRATESLPAPPLASATS